MHSLPTVNGKPISSNHLVLDSKLTEITPKIPVDSNKTQRVDHWKHVLRIWSFVPTYLNLIKKKKKKIHIFCSAAYKKLAYSLASRPYGKKLCLSNLELLMAEVLAHITSQCYQHPHPNPGGNPWTYIFYLVST